MKAPITEHIGVPNIRNSSNNDMVERLQGTIRERNNVMRGLDDEQTAQAIIDGFSRIVFFFDIFLSFFRKRDEDVLKTFASFLLKCSGN
jgi:hypothetical protein